MNKNQLARRINGRLGRSDFKPVTMNNGQPGMVHWLKSGRWSWEAWPAAPVTLPLSICSIQMPHGANVQVSGSDGVLLVATFAYETKTEERVQRAIEVATAIAEDLAKKDAACHKS